MNREQKRHIIVGTAGHVDHGKTLLTKALTGIDTDRLSEEKDRGITIDLGFANLPNEEGLDISIIDVPGHERFIHNMLAGIGGIDIVLLIVAADEGIMPQTREHFEIVKMLGIKKGMVAITKTDMVEDEDWLLMVEEEIRELTKGTFLEDCAIHKVSSVTKEGLKALRKDIIEMAKTVEERRHEPALMRFPVDRVFIIEGFGTVVTGTLKEGSVKVGDELEIYPQNMKTKVRNIQVHGEKVEQAFAGQRVAMNLLNVKKEEIHRGDIIARPDALQTTMMVDVELELFKSADRVLKSDSRVHLSHGPAEIIAKVVLLDKEVLEPGEKAYAQLRLEEETALKKDDRFIVRFYSPVITIGGGVVLDALPPKHKRYKPEILDALDQKSVGDEKTVVEQTLLENKVQMLNERELTSKLGFTKAQWHDNVEKLIDEGQALRLSEDMVFHVDTIKWIEEWAQEILDRYHEKNPLIEGMPKEEFRHRLSMYARINDDKIRDLLIDYMLREDVMKDLTTRIEMADFEIEVDEKQQEKIQKTEEAFKKNRFEFPTVEEIMKNVPGIDRHILEALVAQGKLVKLTDEYWIHRDLLEEAKTFTLNTIDEQGVIALGDFRDHFDTSRKYAIMVLDYFDSKGWTVLKDGVRTRK